MSTHGRVYSTVGLRFSTNVQLCNSCVQRMPATIALAILATGFVIHGVFSWSGPEASPLMTRDLPEISCCKPTAVPAVSWVSLNLPRPVLGSCDLTADASGTPKRELAGKGWLCV